ncbi:hypothetical protein ACOMHN_045255 [Nucella lapillus]
MAVPAGKTPISCLQEYCTVKLKGLTPEYELLAQEGSVHEPTFVMKVKVGDTTAEGKSTSKKKAKHCAARAVLNSLLGLEGDEGETTDNQGTGENGEAVKEEKGVGNPVGELQEFTQKKLIRPPLYTFEDDEAQPHERQFFCTVKLGKLVGKGEGRSKRAAKRNASAAMLEQIKKMSASGTDADQLLSVQTELEMDNVSISNKAFSSSSEKPALLCPPQSKELQIFYENIMKSAGKNLKSANTPAPAANYAQMLLEIASTRKIDANFIAVPEKTTLGQFQTIVTLTSNPVIVCHGCGTSDDDAEASAAHNALQYLRIAINQ